MSRFSLPPSSLHAEKRLSSRILVSLLLTVVTLFITCPKVVAQDTLEYQSVAREYYRRAGAWVVPATMANKKGLAILATGSNVVGVNAPNGTSDFPDQVLLPRSVVSQSSTVFAAMPFSCLGLPLKSDIAIGMNMTSAAEHSHLPITAFAAMPYLRKHAIRLDPGNGKIEVLQEVEASNGDSELSIEWVKDRPSIPIEFPTLGRRSLRVDTGGSGYVALEADRVKALVRMGHIVQRQFGERIRFNFVTGNETRTPETLNILRWLEFGGVRFHNVLVETNQEESIGLGLLHYFRTTLDFPGNRIRLERLTKDDAMHVPMPGGGVTITFHDSDRLVVHHVIKDSAPQRMGIEVGDRVLSLNGLTPPELSKHTIQEILSQVGNTVSLDLQRAEHRFHIDLNVEFPFPWPPAWEPELPTFDPDAATAE